MKKVLYLFIILILLIPFSFSQGKSYFVGTYIRTWPLGDTEEEISKGVYWKGEDLNLKGVDELNIAFGLIRNGSEIFIPDVERGFDLKSELKKLKERYKDLKVIISVGGWGAEGFSDMANDPKLRSEFCDNAKKIILDYDFDGIDIDWEYPVGPDWGLPIKTRPEDRENYVILLSDLRNMLFDLSKNTGKKYVLSVAVPASPWFLQKNDVVAVSKIVDHLKVMSYDYYGSWSSTTGHHANLYNNPKDPAWGGWSTDQAVKLYLSVVPSEKIWVGVPFYGRGWKGVKNENNGLFQPYKESIEVISWDKIKELMKSGKFNRYWDDIANAPYLFDGDIFITYMDEEALDYVIDYVKRYKLGGIFAWEYAHDMKGELLEYISSKK